MSAEGGGARAMAHIDALQLEVGVAVVGAGRVNAMLIGDDLPELCADLVTALASLDCNDLTHVGGSVGGTDRER